MPDVHVFTAHTTPVFLVHFIDASGHQSLDNLSINDLSIHTDNIVCILRSSYIWFGILAFTLAFPFAESCPLTVTCRCPVIVPFKNT